MRHEHLPVRPLFAIVVFVLVLVAGSARSAEAGNIDAFPGLEVQVPFEADLAAGGATIQEDEPPTCYGPPTASVWLTWVATSAHRYSVTASSDSTLLAIAVLDDGGDPSLGTLFYQGCDFPSIVEPERPDEWRVLFDSQPGHRYFIQLAAFEGSLGNVHVRFERPGAPFGNNRSAPREVSVGDEMLFDLLGATVEPDEPETACATAPPDGFIDSTVWLRYQSGNASEHVIFDVREWDVAPWVSIYTDEQQPFWLGCGSRTAGFVTQPNTSYLIQVGVQAFEGGLPKAGKVRMLIYPFEELQCAGGDGETFTDPPNDASGFGQPTSDIASLRIDANVDVTCLTFTYKQNIAIGADPSGMLDTNIYIDDIFADGSPYDGFCAAPVTLNPNLYLYAAASMGSNVAALFRDTEWERGMTPPRATFTLSGNQIVFAAPTEFLGQGYGFALSTNAGNPEAITDCAPNSGFWTFAQTTNPFVGDTDCDGIVGASDILPVIANVGDLDMAIDGCPPVGVPLDAPLSDGGTANSGLAFGDFNCDGVVDLQDALFLLLWANDPSPPAHGCWDVESHIIPAYALPATLAP